jgi:hypothetical protein
MSDESPPGGPGEPESSGAEVAPEEIAELAASCIDYVRTSVGVELDLTLDTLSVLDHYVVAVRADVAVRPELQELLTRAVGAYFGEVIRRTYGGFWRMPSADVHEWRLCQRQVFLAFNPLGMAFDALKGVGEHRGPSSAFALLPDEREIIWQRLQSVPPVADDEFFLLSTRAEALEIVIETLRELMRRRGIEETEYENVDYDDHAHLL